MIGIPLLEELGIEVDERVAAEEAEEAGDQDPAGARPLQNVNEAVIELTEEARLGDSFGVANRVGILILISQLLQKVIRLLGIKLAPLRLP